MLNPSVPEKIFGLSAETWTGVVSILALSLIAVASSILKQWAKKNARLEEDQIEPVREGQEPPPTSWQKLNIIANQNETLMKAADRFERSHEELARRVAGVDDRISGLDRGQVELRERLGRIEASENAAATSRVRIAEKLAETELRIEKTHAALSKDVAAVQSTVSAQAGIQEDLGRRFMELDKIIRNGSKPAASGEGK
jgi:septation ring formation regulator EzrA